VVGILSNFWHTPYFPAFHRPGWLLRYIVGPFDDNYWESFINDIAAGITVAMTLIPQALSYGQLANLSPIQGLYAAVLPSATYTFFGSSLQLAVGPVAIVSLLTGELITKYGVNFKTDPERALDVAAQLSFCVGVILTFMGVLNLGKLISLMAHPVMSGFTTGAAMLIGISQLKAVFNFQTVPQLGQTGIEYNHQVMRWYVQHFNDHYPVKDAKGKAAYGAGNAYLNPYAMRICFGLYFALMAVHYFKGYIKATPERKQTRWYRLFTIATAQAPLVAIIIGAHAAWQIKHNTDYTHKSQLYKHNTFYSQSLKIVGAVTPGLNDILRRPNFNEPFGKMFSDVIPLTLIAYMESYSVARRIAAARNEVRPNVCCAWYACCAVCVRVRPLPPWRSWFLTYDQLTRPVPPFALCTLCPAAAHPQREPRNGSQRPSQLAGQRRLGVPRVWLVQPLVAQLRLWRPHSALQDDHADDCAGAGHADGIVQIHPQRGAVGRHLRSSVSRTSGRLGSTARRTSLRCS
jgi:hypothetical protein